MHNPYLFAIFLSLGVLASTLAFGAWMYFLQKESHHAYSFDRSILVAVLFTVATFAFVLAGEIAKGFL
jgi:hypothetical protein